MISVMDLTRGDEIFEKDQKTVGKQRIIYGTLVSFLLLPSDFDFWLETRWYVYFLYFVQYANNTNGIISFNV